MAPALSPSVNLVVGDSETHSTLSRGESIGLAFDTEAGLCSALAASVILAIIFRNQYKKQLQWEAIQIYVINLFSAEIIHGLSHAISMKWVIEGDVNAGTFCTTQGVLQQLGATCVALATLIIAVQTFATIWWLHEPSIRAATITISIQWIFVILFVAIGFGVHTHYATPMPYWCWLGKDFLKEGIAGEYVWVWLTIFVSIASYLPLFLLHWGVIIPGPAWYAPSTEGEQKAPSEEGDEVLEGDNDHGEEDNSHEVKVKSKAFSRKPARLWTAIVYPIAYCLVVLPWSAIRLRSYKHQISPVVTFIFITLFSLSGVVNAVVYPLTRPRIFEGVSVQAPSHTVEESSMSEVT